jgi:hypothetical protein
MDDSAFAEFTRSFAVPARRAGLSAVGAVLVAVLVFVRVANVAGQEPDHAFDLLVSIVDDTTCGDGVGRTYRTATMLSAARKENAADFFNRH